MVNVKKASNNVVDVTGENVSLIVVMLKSYFVLSTKQEEIP
jgi:hypothetical protein